MRFFNTLKLETRYKPDKKCVDGKTRSGLPHHIFKRARSVGWRIAGNTASINLRFCACISAIMSAASQTGRHALQLHPIQHCIESQFLFFLFLYFLRLFIRRGYEREDDIWLALSSVTNVHIFSFFKSAVVLLYYTPAYQYNEWFVHSCLMMKKIRRSI